MKGAMKAKSEQRKTKCNFINKKHLLPILIFSSSLLAFTLTKSANANTLSNDNYSINVNTIDTNPQPTPKQEVLGTKSIQVKEFTTGPNYTVIAPHNSLSIGLSQNTIDYGILSSTNPVIRTSTVLLNDSSLGGETLSYENHPLTSVTNDVIQNTSCDNGTCTPEIAAVWNNTLTYGFGYRCDNSGKNSCDPQFSSPDYFKSFADSTTDHTPQAIMTTSKGKAQVIITYKVNISGTQKAGGYYNSITYLAIPNF